MRELPFHERKMSNLGLPDHMWEIKHGKWPLRAGGRVTRSHIGEITASSRWQGSPGPVGDNRVARPRWMDDMYTINIRQTLRRAPLCEVGFWTTVEMDGAVHSVQGQPRGYLAGKPATWTFEKPAGSTFDKTSA